MANPVVMLRAALLSANKKGSRSSPLSIVVYPQPDF